MMDDYARKLGAAERKAFWEKAPGYDSLAFWTLALSQSGRLDAYGRELIVIGHGAAGEILCTREYGEHRQRIAKRRGIGERSAATRRARQLAASQRIRAIQDAALARTAI